MAARVASPSVRLTENIVRRARQVQFEDFPAPIVGVVKSLVLDSVAVGLAGASEPPIQRYLSYCKRAGLHHNGRHGVFGHGGLKLPIVNATAVNGMMVHVEDYEAMWHPPTHANSPILPALLAASELSGSEEFRHKDGEGVSGAEFIRAYGTAIEVQGRLRMGNEKLKNIGNFVQHPPGFVGTIGSALGSGLLLNLSEAQLRCALGVASSRTGGLMGNVGSDTKSLHCGLAAANGLESAMMAKSGFTANMDMLEHPRGFLSGFYGADEYDLEAAERDFLASALETGDAALDKWRMWNPGFATKFYPAHYSQQYVISNALDLRQQLLSAGYSPNEVESVTIHAPRYDYVNRPRPQTGIEGKFSQQFCAAVALLDGDVTLETFKWEDLMESRPDVAALLERVRILPDTTRRNELTDMELHIEATVRGEDGVEHFLSTNPVPPGHWKCTKPRLELVKAKAARCFEYAGVEPERAAFIQSAISELEHLSPRDLQQLMRDISAGSPEAWTAEAKAAESLIGTLPPMPQSVTVPAF